MGVLMPIGVAQMLRLSSQLSMPTIYLYQYQWRGSGCDRLCNYVSVRPTTVHTDGHWHGDLSLKSDLHEDRNFLGCFCKKMENLTYRHAYNRDGIDYMTTRDVKTHRCEWKVGGETSDCQYDFITTRLNDVNETVSEIFWCCFVRRGGSQYVVDMIALLTQSNFPWCALFYRGGAHRFSLIALCARSSTSIYPLDTLSARRSTSIYPLDCALCARRGPLVEIRKLDLLLCEKYDRKILLLGIQQRIMIYRT